MYELKKMESYLRVNLLGLGSRLMKKEFIGPRSHKGWETLSYTILHEARPWLGNTRASESGGFGGPDGAFFRLRQLSSSVRAPALPRATTSAVWLHYAVQPEKMRGPNDVQHLTTLKKGAVFCHVITPELAEELTITDDSSHSQTHTTRCVALFWLISPKHSESTKKLYNKRLNKSRWQVK